MHGPTGGIFRIYQKMHPGQKGWHFLINMVLHKKLLVSLKFTKFAPFNFPNLVLFSSNLKEIEKTVNEANKICDASYNSLKEAGKTGEYRYEVISAMKQFSKDMDRFIAVHNEFKKEFEENE